MWFRVLEALIVAGMCVLSSVRCMQVFQLQRYQMKKFTGWVTGNVSRHLKRYGLPALVTAVIGWYLPILLSIFIQVERTRNTISGWAVLGGFCIAVGIGSVGELQEARTGFRMTMRIRRLMTAHAVLFVLIGLLLALLRITPYLMYALVPFVSWAAGRIMKPIEDRINKGFYMEAKEKLRARRKRGDLICVGITGSRGKTATKFILRDMLKTKYDVLITPASYNTAMGVSQTINDNLKPEHQVFIAEMGAQYKGDIRMLVNLVHPKYGVITSIDRQHLDTLGSMENVMKTKEELIRGLPEDGEAFFAAGSSFLDSLYERCERTKFRASVGDAPDAYFYTEEMRFDAEGTHFELRDRRGGRYCCTTSLLGRFNVQDIVLAATVASRIGIPTADIVESISRLKPLSQHMELKSHENGVTLIDDRANRSAAGAADALNVLAAFPGKRILVTGGLDDTGYRPEESGRDYGAMMRSCVDYLILVGDEEELAPIAQGAVERREGYRGLKRNGLRYVADMEDAWSLIEREAHEGDVVLLEGWLE